MTFRDKLADWISGGKLTLWKDANKQTLNGYLACEMYALECRNALREIRDTTATGKSGTARRIHRIANEALE